jgi:PAS domain S-box-containing protein
MVSGDAPPRGLAVDILKDIARQKDWKLIWQHDSFSGALKRLKTGEIDLVIPLPRAESQATFFDCTDNVILQSWGCLFALRNGALASLPDVQGKRVAYVQNSMLIKPFQELLKRFGLDCELIAVPSNQAMFDGLFGKHYDGGIGDQSATSQLSPGQAERLNRSMVFCPVRLKAAVRKGDPSALLPALNDYLAKGQSDSHSLYAQHMQKWFPNRPHCHSQPLMILGALLGLTLFAFLAYLISKLTTVRRTLGLREGPESPMVVKVLLGGILLGLALWLAISCSEYTWFNRNNYSFAQVFMPFNDAHELLPRVLFIGAFLFAGILVSRILERLLNLQQNTARLAEKLRITLNAIGDAVMATDATGRITQMNPVAEQLTGWQLEEARGKLLTEVLHMFPDGNPQEMDNPVEILSKGEIMDLSNHTVLASRDSRQYRIARSGSPIKNSRGEILGVVLVFRDITQEHKLQEELLTVQKLKSVGTLAGGIAHDFNNILTAIFGNIELALHILPKEHEARSILKDADQALLKAKSLTHQLLTFAKGGSPILGVVNLRETVQKSVHFNLSGSNVKAHLNLPAALWQAKADQDQIHQVLANLTRNACQAMPQGGTLDIAGENIQDLQDSLRPHLTGDFIKLTIRDNGPGIPAQNLERIFDPYFSTKPGSSGLGLAIVHSIIDKHRGHIGVDSSPGIGTTFTVLLPADKSAPEPARPLQPQASAEPSSASSGHVLVMDDEETIRDVATAMLEACDYQVDSAVDGEEALQKYASAQKTDHPFDLVIMDLTIPGGMGGKEAVLKLLKLDPQAKAIVTSGYSTDAAMANYRDYGFKGKLVKPFQLKDLRQEVERVLNLP